MTSELEGTALTKTSRAYFCIISFPGSEQPAQRPRHMHRAWTWQHPLQSVPVVCSPLCGPNLLLSHVSAAWLQARMSEQRQLATPRSPAVTRVRSRLARAGKWLRHKASWLRLCGMYLLYELREQAAYLK